jgi:hypothetical protein
MKNPKAFLPKISRKKAENGQIEAYRLKSVNSFYP